MNFPNKKKKTGQEKVVQILPKKEHQIDKRWKKYPKLSKPEWDTCKRQVRGQKAWNFTLHAADMMPGINQILNNGAIQNLNGKYALNLY